AERPRLVVFRSNRGIEAQLVDDLEGKTLASASWLQLKKGFKGSKTERAAEVGKLLAQSAKQANVETVVFDRGGYLYHGRVKALAEAAREGGLKVLKTSHLRRSTKGSTPILSILKIG